ncbi:MAG: hypothetical protein WAW11_02680 [Patescibacteria group bacterium]
MKELMFLLLIVFAISMIFAYRHNLKHFFREMHYGKDKYVTIKAIMYGDYEEFREACYKLINFERFGYGGCGCSYSHPSEEEKRLIVEVARQKGWLLRFMSDTSENMRKVFIYPDSVKEEEIFSPIF